MTDAISEARLSDGETTVWRYVLGGESPGTSWGWAIAYLDSHGYFSTVSDFGNYAYRWVNFGPTDFRVFFMALRPDYVLRKISSCEVYDGKATLRRVKEHILRERRAETVRTRSAPGQPTSRRDGPVGWTRAEARSEWELAVTSGMDGSEFEFWRWCDGTCIEDPQQFHEHRPDSDAVGFVERTLPRLQALVRAQLASEGERAKGMERQA
jgi:hypothetical protein